MKAGKSRQNGEVQPTQKPGVWNFLPVDSSFLREHFGSTINRRGVLVQKGEKAL
jgi:hypothetical protein